MVYTLNIYHLLLASCFIVTLATLSPKSPKKRDQKLATDSVSGPQDYSVFKKNLVVPNVTSRVISDNHAAFFREIDNYIFDGMVLGYVTPWNSHGYDVAQIFGNKFTHISPVWLQVKRRGARKYEITGTHDVDKNWVTHIRNSGRERNLKVVPRILLEEWTSSDFKQLFHSKEEVDALIESLIKTTNEWNFDGLVLEVWLQLVQAVNNDILINFIQKIGEAFLVHDLEFILVIPANRQVELFNDKHFAALYDYVSAFSLMSYDYSSPQQPGPNAPIKWIQKCITSLTSSREKRKKILAGLNFYGYDYSSSNSKAVTSSDYLKALFIFGGKLVYDSESVEHHFSYEVAQEKHVVYYPTLYSINKRISLAKDLGAGLSIWELGQGLDYFYDLL